MTNDAKLDRILENQGHMEGKVDVALSKIEGHEKRLDVIEERLESEQKWKIIHPTISGLVAAVGHGVARIFGGGHS